MKAKNKVLFLLLIVVLFSAIYLACTNEEKAIEKSSISVFCDESIYSILKEPFSEFNAHFKGRNRDKQGAGNKLGSDGKAPNGRSTNHLYFKGFYSKRGFSYERA